MAEAPQLASTTSTLTPQQLSNYLNLISSSSMSLSGLQEQVAAEPLVALTRLVRLQLSTIPYTSLASHYSATALVSLDTSKIYEKLVVYRRGGHCIEMNWLFAAAIRALGYELFVTAARISIAVDTGNKEAEGYGMW